MNNFCIKKLLNLLESNYNTQIKINLIYNSIFLENIRFNIKPNCLLNGLDLDVY